MAFGQGGQSQHQGSGGVSGSYRTGSRQERTGEQEEDMHQLRQQQPHLLQSRLPKAATIQRTAVSQGQVSVQWHSGTEKVSHLIKL